MTTPEDPNASQPGWGAPPPPQQPGWGAPPPAQPGWGAPPPTQPGWGAPPPQQPGWPQPQPQPGWGQPQPGWGAPPQKKGHGCLIAALIVIGLILLGVGGCVYLVAPTVMTDIKLTQELGGRASSVEFRQVNGSGGFVIHLAAAYDSQATSIACNIVGPTIRSSGTPNAHWEIVDSRGYAIAAETTPCP